MYWPDKPQLVTDGCYDDPDEAVYDETTCFDCTASVRPYCGQYKYNVEHYGEYNNGNGSL